MKNRINFTFVTLVIGIFFILLIFNQISIAQDRPPYEIPTPAPCTFIYGFEDENCVNTPWSTERKYKKILIGQCSFWVIYHDRVCNWGTPQNTEYTTNVVGIIYQGLGCDETSNAKVLEKFRLEIYQEVFSQNPNWYPWNNGTLDSTKVTMFSYSTATCNQADINGNLIIDSNLQVSPCDNHQYCCQRAIWLSKVNNSLRIDTLNPNFVHVKWVGWKEGQSRDTCSIPCIADCFQPLRTRNISPCYNDSCNFVDSTKWTIKEVNFNLPQCPNCKISVNLKTRRANFCPAKGDTTWNDMIIDNMSMHCSGSQDTNITNCIKNIDKNFVYNYTLDYLIRNEFLQYPDTNKTSKYYRIFKSTCWADFNPPEGGNRKFYECAPVENCCWMQIQMTTGSDGLTHTYNILHWVHTSNQCLSTHYNCDFYCEPF